MSTLSTEISSQMTPREIVQELDKHIIGQDDAKRAVAIALRNRWRRSQVDDALKNEITPKNILMIGPTGVGKTEIARRLAKLANAPFVKVEATKFTEVGYVGRDVESIIRDLIDISIKLVREQEVKKVRSVLKKRQRIVFLISCCARHAAVILVLARVMMVRKKNPPKNQAPGRNSAKSCARVISTTRKLKWN